jgi:hypothetical protein
MNEHEILSVAHVHGVEHALSAEAVVSVFKTDVLAPTVIHWPVVDAPTRIAPAPEELKKPVFRGIDF